MRLEQARSNKVLQVGGGVLVWEDVLKVAKDAKYASRLVTDEEIMQQGAPPSTSWAPTAPPSTTTTRAPQPAQAAPRGS